MHRRRIIISDDEHGCDGKRRERPRGPCGQANSQYIHHGSRQQPPPPCSNSWNWLQPFYTMSVFASVSRLRLPRCGGRKKRSWLKLPHVVAQRFSGTLLGLFSLVEHAPRHVTAWESWPDQVPVAGSHFLSGGRPVFERQGTLLRCD